MNKSFGENVLAVVIGIALLLELLECVQLIVNGAIMGDALLFASGEDLTKLTEFVKWSSIGLGCLLVSALLSCALAYFSKGRVLKIISAVIWLGVVVSSITLLFVLRKLVIDMLDASLYAAGAEFMNEMLIVALPAVLLCVYFILDSIMLFGKKEVKTNEEV